jgi:DNA-binding transcriptional MocR family regulator
LPSVRQLRDAHGVSASTAVGCYLWLERHGYVRARPKSGFYVIRLPLADGPRPVVASRMRGPVPVNLAALDSCRGPVPAGKPIVEMGPAVVGSALLPMHRLNRSIRIALSAFADHAVRYEDPRGNARLRRQIARLIFRQGAAGTPDDIVITSGATEALNLAIRAVARAGDVIAVESPGCFDILHALEVLKMRAVEIPHVLHRGIDLDQLRAATRRHRVKAVLVNVTCHNPLGDCTDDASKAEIVAFAKSQGLPIIEGDTFGDLVFSGARPKPLKAFDTAGLVIQCASLAHYVAPGFNLGYCHAGRWQPEIERLKAITSVATARLPQLALAEFLESGGFDKHLKRLRVALWQSVETSRQEVLRRFPAGTRVSQPEGGFVLWIQLPDGLDGSDVQRQAATSGIRILPGALFSPNQRYRNFIRIACGQPIDVLLPAIRTLADIVRESRVRKT